MSTRIPNIMHQRRFWFYTRKALFQGVLPIVLGLLTFYDVISLANNESNEPKGETYLRLYIYTSTILFIYAHMRILLEFIFSICADDIIFKKEINLSKTTADLTLDNNIFDVSDSNHMIIIKKIFKLRYSNSRFFKFISGLCWYLGIDAPILIPKEIIVSLSNDKSNITLNNEQKVLYETLNQLCLYHPTKYDQIMDNESVVLIDMASENLINKPAEQVRLDKSISFVQSELFNGSDNRNVNREDFETI